MSLLFLSIDFEDFSHDLGRDLGLWKTRPLRLEALTRAYEAIECFLQAHGGARATFFCTGIIAEQTPGLIARIAAEGHEIACHYHFHDHIDEETPEAFEANLLTALKALRAASGQSVTGFRAPKFRIPQTSPAHYNILAQYVDYDSSFLAAHPHQAKAFAASLATPLKLLPVYAARPAALSPKMRLGGTYMKLFPRAATTRLIASSEAAGLPPHIYLHPYEFLSDGSFTLSRKELAPLGPAKAAYWRVRQAQWHTVGNRSLPQKLSHFALHHGLGGRLDQNLQTLAF
jgi:Polysaccharide deacetylase